MKSRRARSCSSYSPPKEMEKPGGSGRSTQGLSNGPDGFAQKTTPVSQLAVYIIHPLTIYAANGGRRARARCCVVTAERGMVDPFAVRTAIFSKSSVVRRSSGRSLTSMLNSSPCSRKTPARHPPHTQLNGLGNLLHGQAHGRYTVPVNENCGCSGCPTSFLPAHAHIAHPRNSFDPIADVAANVHGQLLIKAGNFNLHTASSLSPLSLK